MKFGEALEAVKSGAKIYREGWNGKGQFVIKAGGYTVSEPRPGSDYAKAGITGEFTIAPHLDLKNAQGIMQPGWVPSMGDLFADDWLATPVIHDHACINCFTGKGPCLGDCNVTDTNKSMALSFEDVVKPVIKWLNENANQHALVIIDVTNATLLIGEIGIRTEKYLKD